MIATELALHYEELASNLFGKFVLKNCKIDQFKAKRQLWLQTQARNSDKRQLFNDLLPQSSAPSHTIQCETQSSKGKLKRKANEENGTFLLWCSDKLKLARLSCWDLGILPQTRNKRIWLKFSFSLPNISKENQPEKVGKLKPADSDSSIDFLLKAISSSKRSDINNKPKKLKY
jgi:hypothetical protein